VDDRVTNAKAAVPVSARATQTTGRLDVAAVATSPMPNAVAVPAR
jgi:hypothetical protein